MALTLPALNGLKSPFSGLTTGFQTTTANSTPAFAGSMAVPKIPASGFSSAPTQNSQTMPLLGSPGVGTPAPAPTTNTSTALAVPAGFNNPNSSMASDIAAKTAAPSPTAPTRTMSTAPVPTTPNINITPSGSVVNAATGGVMQASAAPAAPSVAAGTPASLYGSMYTSPEYQSAVKRYQDSLKPTDEEDQTNLDLENIQSSLRQAYTNAEKQAIPLEFITGQQKRLQDSAATIAMPLEAKAARLQAKRLAALDASKFMLEQEDKKINANKPVSIGEGQSLVNPLTGETVYTAPKKATTTEANQDPARVLSVDEAKNLGVPYGTTMGDAAKLGKTPGQAEAGKDTLGGAVSVIDQLLGDTELLKGISGVPSPAAFIPGTKSQKAVNLYNQLKGMLSLENRTALKGSGAISDFEAKTLERAASSLGRNLSDADFAATLQDLKLDLTAGKMLKDGIPPDVIEKVIGKKLPFSAAGNASASTVSIPQTSRLAYVNNNPGNLRFASQPGAVQGEGGFAKFASPEAGAKALEAQIKLDASRGHTLASFVSKYAPPTENDTEQYIKQIAAATGTTPMTSIADIDIRKLVAAIARKESGTKIA